MTAACLLTQARLEATSAWTNTGTGNFSTPGNWSTGEVPDGTNDVVVANGGTVQVNSHEATANLTIDGSSTFSLLDGANSNLVANGTLIVGNTSGGTFTIGNQAFFSNTVLESFNSYFGYYSDAEGSLQLVGGEFNTSELYLGFGGAGAFNLSSGSQMFTGQAWLGYSPDSTGTLTLTGSSWRTVGILVTDFPDVTVGNEGNGVLQATDSHIEVGNLILSANPTSSSSVTLSGGSLKASEDILVGQDAAASFSATNTDVEARAFFVGRFVPGDPTEAILSGGSLSLSADLHVGALGTGSLTLSNGGTMQSDIGNIGFGPNAEGTITIVNGQWTNDRGIFVGVEGKGTLNIEAQGVIHSESGFIGQDAGGMGTVTMSGGSWTMSNTLAVGVNGEGNFQASDGAQVTSQFSQLGVHTGSAGHVQLLGTSWTTTETLTIGVLANGSFQAGSNSTVTAGAVELGSASGVSGYLLIEGSTLITDNILAGGGSGTVDFDAATLQVLGGSAVNTILIDGFNPGDVTTKSGGLTINTYGAEAEIASGLGGTGALTKIGAGRLLLSSENTYAGGTNILGGVLAVSGPNNVGTGDVVLGSAELRAHTDSAISGNLSGGIQLVSVSSDETGIFSAASNQTLTLSPLDFLLVAGSTMQVGSAGNDGNVVLAPTGATALTVTSAVNVVAGTLTAGNSALENITSVAQSVTVAENATLDFNNQLSGGGISAIFGAGTVQTGSSSDTTLVAESGNFTGLITGSGALRKETMGTLVIGAGGNIQVDGGVSIHEGTLQVNGSIGNGLGEVEVNAGGTLSGTGLVGPVKLQGGTLAPGNSAGTLTAADLLWYAGLLEFDLGSDQNDSDFLIVGSLEGFASSYGFTFFNHGWQENFTYNLIQFAGTNIVDASHFTFTNGGGFDGTFALSGNMLQFTLLTIPEPGTANLLLLGVAAWSLLRKNSRKSV